MDTDEYKNTSVKELSAKDYIIKNDVVIKKNKKSGLVIFYNYWCGYCQLVKPIMIKLSENKNHNFYAIHGENPTNEELYKHFMIQGVPQIRYLHKNGKIGDIYNGERNAESMLMQLTQKSGQKGGGVKRKSELKHLTKPVLLKRIRNHEKKTNTKSKISMKNKKEDMINYIDSNIKERKVVFDLENNKKKNIGVRTSVERESRKNQLRKINANKKKTEKKCKSII